MEVKGSAYRASDMKYFNACEFIIPDAYTDPELAIECMKRRVIAQLGMERATQSQEIRYTIPSFEYDNLLKSVRKKARQEGREEAWDLSQRVNLLPDVKEGAYGIDDLGEAFGTCDWSKVISMPVEEALKKDKAYQEEKKALHIGDEVKFFVSDPIYKVVTGYIIGFESGLYGESCVRILAKHGSYLKSPEMCKKTGKHNPDIEKVMASFEEEKE